MSNSWVCPCNGCKKAQKVIIDQIIEEYRSCLNIIDDGERLYCHTWWRHDDCLRLMNLLHTITKNDKYSIPPVRQEVSEAINHILDDPKTTELLNKLGSDYDKNGIPYWHRYEERLKYMEDNGI
jgi:hypothetical protein